MRIMEYIFPRTLSPTFCPVAVACPWQITCTTRFGLPFVRELPVVQGEALTAPVKVQDVESDGSCFFRCLSLTICGVETYHPVVRAKLCQFMKCNAEVASSIGENIEEYIKKLDESGMKYLGKWATARELFGAAMWLDCDVYTTLLTNGSVSAAPTPT